MHKPRALIDRETLQQRVTEMAQEITRDYAQSEVLSAVGVLKGSVYFMVDLTQQIPLPMVVDFFQTSSYSGGKVPGEVRIRKDVDMSVRGRDVLLIEDIVDTGHTLRTVLGLLEARGANSVRLCSLLNKKEAREVEIDVHYCGFDVGNEFVVGYGLDYDEQYRNLDYIGVID